MNRLSVDSSPMNNSLRPSFQVQDHDSFPTLSGKSQSKPIPALSNVGIRQGGPHGTNFASSPRRYHEHRSSGIASPYSSSGSRPNSRNQMPQSGKSMAFVDDSEAFPSLGALGLKISKKHHGKRGGHYHHKENSPNSIADVVRMSPGPASASVRKTMTKAKAGSTVSGGHNTIHAPQHIPWLETGAKTNQEYLKARQEAIKHGALRNKFLQR